MNAHAQGLSFVLRGGGGKILAFHRSFERCRVVVNLNNCRKPGFVQINPKLSHATILTCTQSFILLSLAPSKQWDSTSLVCTVFIIALSKYAKFQSYLNIFQQSKTHFNNLTVC